MLSDEEQIAKTHFLRNIRQMQTIAILMQMFDDGQLRTVYISDGFAKMMECTPAEAAKLMDGVGFINTTHPEDRVLVRNILKNHVSADGSSDLIIRKVTGKGHQIWCNVHYAFIDDFDEHYLYCTYFNVTVLKEYEERLRGVYMSIGNNFYQLSERTLGMFRVNLTRDTIEDMQGKDLFDTDSIDRPYSEVMRLRAENYPVLAERECFLERFDSSTLTFDFLDGKVNVSQVLYSKRKDGRQCFVNYAANLTRHPMTGDVVAFISEQECNSDKVNDMLLSKILARQFDMVAYIADGRYGVVIGDAAQIGKGSIFPASRHGDYKQYIDNQVCPVLHGSDEQKAAVAAALALETIEERLKSHEPYVVNISCDIEGETYHKSFDFYSIDPDAKFYILLKSDTTEIQKEQMERNEQLRVALDEAKQASVAKTAFLSSMSHEIRTPMNAIIGLGNIALKDPALPASTREHLEKINVSARHLLSLINDILDMSRIESGRMALKNEEFSFSSFIEQINTLINSQCQDMGLSYDCVVHGKIDEYYIGDVMKLKQVLINILGNAVKFTNPPDGKVSLSVERIAQFDGQSTVRFIIKDTGIGMDKDYLPKIFEAFSQEDSTTTSKYGGSGLGLAITKNIVEMMNGSINVESVKGEGSTFIVDVTLKDVTSCPLKQTDFDVDARDLHVLVIDDDPVACQHAKIVLEEIGIAADTCLSGKEALDLIQLHHARREVYNLILVDLDMPEQDGVEVTRHIRKIIGSESAIIILTAYSWTEIEGDALAAGVDSFLVKPLFASNALSEFQQAFRRKKLKESKNRRVADLNGRRILLVEDMLINAEIMKQLLEMRGMTVEHAENGKLAVDLFASKPEHYFDAVLMDVRMPVMDGLAATSAIRALDHPDAKLIPIIAMTANAFDEDVQRSLQAGMNAHLSKPVEPEHLYATLEGLIQTEPFVSGAS